MRRPIFLAVTFAAVTAVGDPGPPPPPAPPTQCDEACDRCLQEHHKKDPAPKAVAAYLRFREAKLRNAELRLEVVKCASKDNRTVSEAIPPITLSVIPLLPTKIVRMEPSTASPGAEFTIHLSSAIDFLPYTAWSVTVNGENVPVAVVGATLRGRLPNTTGAVPVVVNLKDRRVWQPAHGPGARGASAAAPCGR